MDNKIFNQESIIELESAMKNTENKRMYVRYSVVLKHFQGLSNKAIAKMECLEEHTVRNYIKNYKNKGVDGLIMNKSSGTPRKLNSEQEKKLIDVITNNTPDEVGFNSRKNWLIQFYLIEGLWGWLKSSIINNVFFESIYRVKNAIGNFIENINKVPTQIIDRLCVKM